MGKRITLALIFVLIGLFCCGYNCNPDGIPEAIVINNSNTIIIGDSRMVLVHDAVGDSGCDWFATAGSGFERLENFSKFIDLYDLTGKNIIISYGINDINPPTSEAFFKYQNFMITKAQEWIDKGAKIYFTDIPQVTDTLKIYTGISTPVEEINRYVAAFNNLSASEGFPENIGHIGLTISDESFHDGIHYDEKACKYVFKRFMEEVNPKGKKTYDKTRN